VKDNSNRCINKFYRFRYVSTYWWRGFAVGYALKKIAKFVLLGIGLLALLIGYLEYQKWISANWTVTSTFMTQAAHKPLGIVSKVCTEIL
jgi:uncharacterized membrane protein (Fun14 family)